MREILFRGKYSKKSPDWIEGSFHRDEDTNICEIAYRYYKKEGETKAGIWVYGVVDPETVGQYTGLKDKNGKKIFEGDILHIAKISDGLGDYYHPPLDCPVNVVVKWDLCAWIWETLCYDKLCDDKMYITFPNAWCHYECEVIGNIYDNPELIGR